MKRKFISLVGCAHLLLASPLSANTAGWRVYRDEAKGFSIAYPDESGSKCGRGAAGEPYQDVFGCAEVEPGSGRLARLLVLAVENRRGFFEHNVQTSHIRAQPDEVLKLLSEARRTAGYAALSPVSVDGVQALRFRKSLGPLGAREVWYLLRGDLLLEVNLRTPEEAPSDEAPDSAASRFRRIAETLRFLPVPPAP